MNTNSFNILTGKYDFRGRFKVYGKLGEGSCGAVYLAYCKDTGLCYALKTFKDEYMQNNAIKSLFRQEAEIWIHLGRHPHIVRASFVEEIEGRLCVAAEYIAPYQTGMLTLQDYLTKKQSPTIDSDQILIWSIQFCYGMIHAYSRGLKCHRDIKPGNILIDHKKAVRINDFGLAQILDKTEELIDGDMDTSKEKDPKSSMIRGTPTHMAPEQFKHPELCDERSDIYSFGIVLYEMVSGGRIPFNIPFPTYGTEENRKSYCKKMENLHNNSPVPLDKLYKDDSEFLEYIKKIIKQCLSKKPFDRYQTFGDLCEDLKIFSKKKTGKEILEPKHDIVDEIVDLINKGNSFDRGILDNFQKAISCFDEALDKIKLIPDKSSRNYLYKKAFYNKGLTLDNYGFSERAIDCYTEALKIDEKYFKALHSKGVSLAKLRKHLEAIEWYKKALDIQPDSAMTWLNKGTSYYNLYDYDNALECINQALKIDKNFPEALEIKEVVLKAKYQLDRIDRAKNSFKEKQGSDPLHTEIHIDNGSRGETNSISRNDLHKGLNIQKIKISMFLNKIITSKYIKNIIKQDINQNHLIYDKELWRMGVISPDFDKVLFTRKNITLKEKIEMMRQSTNIEQLPMKKTAILYLPTFFGLFQGNTLTITSGNLNIWSYLLDTKIKKGESFPLRQIKIRGLTLFEFLKREGFPLKQFYNGSDPITTERDGIIIERNGEPLIFHSRYFVQRRLIDDEGNFIYIGFDEGKDYKASNFLVELRPSICPKLFKEIRQKGNSPHVIRYRSFPIISDKMLPILDTPMSCNGWTEIFIDPRGVARLFISKNKEINEWYAMMDELKTLFMQELEKKNYHLLGLTKDENHLNEYLNKKEAILRNYFVIEYLGSFF